MGNMWHSVVLAVRYWSDKQRDQCASGKVLELHQVASSKERNFIELLHQLSGEEHWSDVISFFLWFVCWKLEVGPLHMTSYRRSS